MPNDQPLPTGGRLGSAGTRAQIAGLAQNLKNRGWTIIGGGGAQPEEYLPPIGGGRAGGNYVEITATKNGVTLRVNTIDTLSDGATPTSREAETQSVDSLLAVVRKGVNRLNNVPATLEGKDRAGVPVTIQAADIKEKGLLIGIPAKPLPRFGTFLQKLREISESEKIAITVQFVEGLEGETLEK